MRALEDDEKLHQAVQVAVQKGTHACLTPLTGGENSTLTDEAIHDIRKQIKALRSLLKLVRSDLGDGAYRRANRCLQEANRPLSGVRDAKVILVTSKKLMARCDCSTAARIRVHKALEGRLEKARVRVAGSPHTRHIIATKLRTAEQLVSNWSESQSPWKILSHGLRGMYAKGRDAMEVATDDKSATNLHELRKRAKDLLYACAFLRKASLRTRSAARDLKRFTDLLGEHRDLAMLQRAAVAGSIVKVGSLRRQLVTLASREQASLRDRAWKIGLRIYEEPAAAFLSRIHRDWKDWRQH